MPRKQVLRKVGGSAALVLPKSMLERFNLEAGDEVTVSETESGILVSPFDPDFAEAMTHYTRISRKYRNALRELAK